LAGPSTDINYGLGPTPNQIEVTIFGPGYGEAVAVHLGLGRWLLVDSCVAKGAKDPASANYLSSIGVSPDSVKVIVASHWHDDHVRGMSKLVKLYPNADLFIPGVFGAEESRAFLATFGGVENPGLTRGTTELYQSLRAHGTWVLTSNRTEVFCDNSSNIPVQVVAYSPTQAAVSAFLADVMSYVPQENADAPIIEAPEIRPNISSIVLHVELGKTSILLGADLEKHSSYGWDVVVSDRWCQARTAAGIFKVSHHGSKTGDHPDIWSRFLSQNATALVSPFNQGNRSLPTAEDRSRILTQTSAAYITSTASRRATLPTEQLKRLEDMATDVRPMNIDFGALRARSVYNIDDWSVEKFGRAGTLQSMGTAA
jgi:beta-lactamase superfamily II metal-dependent hydrolase